MTRRLYWIAMAIMTAAACRWLYLDHQWKEHTATHLEFLNDAAVEARKIDNWHAGRLSALEHEVAE